jgi:hypothetical protein
LARLYDTPALRLKVFNGNTTTDEYKPLQDAVNGVVGAARDVAFMDPVWVRRYERSDKWRFLMVNGPTVIQDAMLVSSELQLQRAEGIVSTFNALFIAFLLVEALLTVPSVIAYVALMARRVARDRTRLFATFLCVPRAAVLELAQRRVRVGGEDEEEEGEDEGDDTLARRALMKRALADDGDDDKGGAGKGGKGQVRLTLEPKHLARLVVSHRSDLTRLLSPLALWFALCLALIAACWSLALRNVVQLYMLRGQALEEVAQARVLFFTNGEARPKNRLFFFFVSSIYTSFQILNLYHCHFPSAPAHRSVEIACLEHEPSLQLQRRHGLQEAQQFLLTVHTANLYGNE